MAGISGARRRTPQPAEFRSVRYHGWYQATASCIVRRLWRVNAAAELDPRPNLNLAPPRPVFRAMENPAHQASRCSDSTHHRRLRPDGDTRLEAEGRRLDPIHGRGRGENTEVARRSFDAFNRSVAEGTDDFYEFLDAEVEWIPITALLDGRTHRRPEGVRRWLDEIRHDWEFYELRWKEARDLGGGRVLALGTWHARGRRGGVQLSFEQAAWLIELRGGKLIRSQTFTDRGKAFEAAGVSVPSSSQFPQLVRPAGLAVLPT
jgi:ketosteroid isomerase-like protein